MKNEKIEIGQLKLIGITTKTSTNFEMNPKASKIGPLVNEYMSKQLANKINYRAHPGVTYLVYTSCKSDGKGENNWFTGKYNCFLGEEVESLNNQKSEFATLTIAQSAYQKFTTAPGKIPEIVIHSWQKIWAMKEHEFDGKLKHLADFEVYDQRAHNPNDAVVDIYIGID